MIISTDGNATQDLINGAVILRAACEAPIRQMAINAGISPDIVIDRVLKSSEVEGWNFRTGQMVNMIEEGVIDPVKVTRVALQNATSCAGTLITTNFGIIQTESK